MSTAKVISLAALLSVLASAPSAACAEGIGVFSPGLLYSNTFGHAPSHGFGVELSYAYHPRNTSTFSLGAFTQAQAYTDGSYRVGGGAQLGWSIAGIELGYAHRTANDQYGGASGLHIAPYLSVGVVSVALRFTLPLSTDEANHPSVLGGSPEVALTFALKLPIRAHGRLPRFEGCGCPRGH